jgi:hypothetical protein
MNKKVVTLISVAVLLAKLASKDEVAESENRSKLGVPYYRTAGPSPLLRSPTSTPRNRKKGRIASL